MDDAKKEIAKVSRTNYPADDVAAFKKIFDAICETYQLTNPVDQIIANRATTQLLMLQHSQGALKKYGLYYVDKGADGQERLTMNQLSYFVKQVESEFRSNIRLLRQGVPKEQAEGPKDFFDLIKDGKTKQKKTKKKS